MGRFFSIRLIYLALVCAATVLANGCAAPAKASKSVAKSTHSKKISDDFPDAATAGLLPPAAQHKQ
jgi:hypothetical protein